jgi:hypothetical protein
VEDKSRRAPVVVEVSTPVELRRIKEPPLAMAEVVWGMLNAVPVVNALALIAMVVAAVVERSSIWKPLPVPVRLPLKLKRTRPLVGWPVAPVVTERALPVRPVLVAEIAKALPLVKALPLTFMIPPDVALFPMMFATYPAVLAPVEVTLRTEPLALPMAPVDVRVARAPVVMPVELEEIDKPLPVVRELTTIESPMPVVRAE